MKVLLVVIAIFISGLAQSQITFTQADFPKPGIKIYYLDGWSDSIDVGLAGPNQMFDFSKVMTSSDDTIELEFEDPSSTPYAANHPNATVAFLSDYEEDSITSQVVFEFWEFLQVNSSMSKYDGATINIDTGYNFSQSPPTSMESVHLDYMPSFENIGTGWTYNSSRSTNTYWTVTIGSLKHDENIIQNIDVDAWGTFINPWRSFDALRFKVVEYISGTDTLNGLQDDSWVDTSYYYEYWVNGLGNYIARVYMDSTFTYLDYYEMAIQKNPVGIEKINIELAISIYPLPSKGLLYVKMEFKGNVDFTISDINGREVVKGQFITNEGYPNEINVEGLKSGIYILNLNSEEKTLARKKIMIE